LDHRQEDVTVSVTPDKPVPGDLDPEAVVDELRPPEDVDPEAAVDELAEPHPADRDAPLDDERPVDVDDEDREV
jgi:hypothetical protein